MSRKYPANYPGSSHRWRGRGRQPQMGVALSKEQMAFVEEHARRERLPRSLIVRRCIQAVMQRYAELYGDGGQL